MKIYVTDELLARAKNEKLIDYDLSNTSYIIFGTVGLDVVSVGTNGKEKYKHINYWKDKTALEINKELNGKKYTILT